MKIHSRFLFLCLISLFFSCSATEPELIDAKICLIFDYGGNNSSIYSNEEKKQQNINTKPLMRLGAFVAPKLSSASHALERISSLKVESLSEGLNWLIENPLNFSYKGEVWLGYGNLQIPSYLQFSKGLYKITCTDFASRSVETFVSLDFDEKIENLTLSDFKNSSSFKNLSKNYIVLYDENGKCLYFGEFLENLENEGEIDALCKTYEKCAYYRNYKTAQNATWGVIFPPVFVK